MSEGKTLLERERWYWIIDQDYFNPGMLKEFTQRGARFLLENGKDIILNFEDMKDIESVDEQCLNSSLSNFTQLRNITEKSLLHLLRKRFLEDRIYSNISNVLIAVNPFRELSIFGNDSIEKYHSTPDKATLEPHIFVTADSAFKNMIHNRCSQSVIISGESGAGKTECIKFILNYILRISRQSVQDKQHSLQDQIIQANPVLEAFGNAQTSRNNNSSRFGKLITLRFGNGMVQEAEVISYLLEHCRVVSHQPRERNYHAFYQLIAACENDPVLAQAVNLTNPHTDFRYAQRDEVRRGENGDLQAFVEVQDAMKVLGIPEPDISMVNKIVAGLLLFGNIDFVPSHGAVDAGLRLQSSTTLETVSEMLGLSPLDLHRSLTSRRFGVRSIVTCVYTIEQAQDARDAFSKKLYFLLFEWIIGMVNKTLEAQAHRVLNCDNSIAMLDIFGFESFEQNSFEQLMINYCNEKLQQHFNNYVFLMEMKEYANEGISMDEIEYVDNSAIIEVFERKGTGLLPMLDEEILVPRGTDETLLSKIYKTYTNHPGKPSGKDTKFRSLFVLSHYAGEVAYSVNGILDRNKNTIPSELDLIGTTSSIPFMANLFSQASTEPEIKLPTRGKNPPVKKVQSLGAQFRSQLAALIDTLNRTEPHFVRCIKSNSLKAARCFESRMVLEQLRSGGLFELCRIRQSGFSVRFLLTTFFRQYSYLEPSAQSAENLAEIFTAAGILQTHDYRIGSSKIFLKHEAWTALENMRATLLGQSAMSTQRCIRGWLSRRRIFHIKQLIQKLRRAVVNQEGSKVKELLGLILLHLRNDGNHFDVIVQARAIVKTYDEEAKALSLLIHALEARSLSQLEDAMKVVRALTPPCTHPLVKECADVIQVLTQEVHSPPRCPTPPRGELARASTGSRGELAAFDRQSSRDSILSEPPGPMRAKLNRMRTMSLSPPRTAHLLDEPVIKRSYSPSSRSENEDGEPSHRRRTILKQMSSHNISCMSLLHDVMKSLANASNRPDGLRESDLVPLEAYFVQLKQSGDSAAQEASDMMMAQVELERARRQIKMQETLLALNLERTPQWKLRNFLQQAKSLGMQNYSVFHQIEELLSPHKKEAAKPAARTTKDNKSAIPRRW